MLRLHLTVLILTCAAAVVVGNRRTCTSRQLLSRRGALASWRQYHVNLRTYTSRLLTWQRQKSRSNELYNIAVSAYGITDILKILYHDSPDRLRQQLQNHILLHNVQPHLLFHVAELVKQTVLGMNCSSSRRSFASNLISLTEVYLRLPSSYTNAPLEETWYWEIVPTGSSLKDMSFRSPLNHSLNSRPIIGVSDLLRDHTDGGNESLVAINVANLRALWKFPAFTSDSRLKLRMDASIGNLRYEMVEAITSPGVYRYLQCEVNGVYKCRRRGMPNIYEVPLVSSSGQEFRMMVYQTTQNLTLGKIQEKFQTEGTKKWNLHRRNKSQLKPATIVMPKVNMTTYYDLIGHMARKGTETAFVREYIDVYGGQNSNTQSVFFPVVYQATKLLAITQFSVSEKGISMGNTPNTNHSTANQVSSDRGVKLMIDSPFMFAIEHVPSNTLVLAGRVTGRN